MKTIIKTCIFPLILSVLCMTACSSQKTDGASVSENNEAMDQNISDNFDSYFTVMTPPPESEPSLKPEKTAVPANDGNETVYITKTGTKYHTKDCYMSKENSRAISLKNAEAKGYEPCKICH